MSDTATGSNFRLFEPHKSYEIGLLTVDSDIQNPVFVKGNRMTIHGTDLHKWNITSVYDLAENKTTKINMRPGRTYQVRELDDFGNPTYFGQFSPKNPPEQRQKKIRPPGLSDDVSRPTQMYSEPVPQAEYKLANTRENPDGYPNRTLRDVREMYELQLKQQAEQFLDRISDKDAEIRRIAENHSQELSRAIALKDSEMFTLQTTIGALEAKVEEWTGNYFEVQKKLIDAQAQCQKLTSDMDSVMADNKRREKTLRDEYDKRIEIMNLDLNTKFARQTQLSGTDSGFMELVKTLPQIIALFNGNTAASPPGVIANPVQNLQGFQGQPPPSPRFIPIPEAAEMPNAGQLNPGGVQS